MFSWLGYSSTSKGRILPKPSGPFSVGFLDYEWRPPRTGHTIHPPAFSLARIYYPSSLEGLNEAEFEARCGLWIPSSDYLPGYGYYMKIPRFLSVPAFKWLAGHLKLWAVENAPVLPKDHSNEKQFPVIVFSHGLAGIRTTYSTICTDLASHGFIVAAIEHRDGSASMTVEQEMVKQYEHPDSKLPESELYEFRAKQLAFRAQEVSATLDLLESLNTCMSLPENLWKLMHPDHAAGQPAVVEALKGRLSFSKTVLMGHSFGAATSFFATSQDTRVHSIVAMDPWMYPLPRQFASSKQHPLLVINSETFHWDTNLSALKALLQRNVGLGGEHASMMVTLKGTGHMDQSDFTVALPSYVTERFRPGQTSDPKAILRSNNDIILAFLKQKVGMQIPSEPATIDLPDSDRQAFEANQSCIIDYY